MKSIKILFSAILLGLIFTGCNKKDFTDTSFVESAGVPAKLTALFTITQDNTGLVTITPNGEGAVSYDVYFGDATTTPVKVQAGKSTTHVYKEGVYNVKLVGYNVSGKTTEATQQLTVTFRAPENLEATVDIDPSNNFKVNVGAKALYETFFQVYFGDVANEVPTNFNEGQTVSHVYAATGTYTVKVVALSGGAAKTEFTKTVTIVDPVLLPVTFESPTLNYQFFNFDGGNASVVNNPYKTGINTSNRVGRMIKGAGQPWGGSVMPLSAPIDFSTNKIFRMKVYSPRVGAKVLLKVENAANGAINFERERTTTVANAWEEIGFDFSTINTANVYNNIVLIFELGTVGDGSPNFTFLFDDIRLAATMPTNQIDWPVTFDVVGTNYTVTDFGNNQSELVNDPTNAANKVMKTTKPNGAETWAGTTIGTPSGFARAIPISTTTSQMSVRVYSPAAGLKIRLKIEDAADGTKSVETDATTTVANTWETLIFDFANPVTGTAAINAAYRYDKASIFFDFGTAGNGKVFYWDDVRYLSTNVVATVSLPLNFENTSLTYTFTNFDGGGATVIDNPFKTGINTSNKVGRMIKGPGQPWGGSFIELGGPIDFSKKTFKMKVYSPRAGAKVLLKVENATNGALNFEKEVTTTVANGWEELTFDYSAINTANSYHKIVLIFELGTVGDGSSNFTFYFDDINLF
ncbi:hypothetical protein [Sediminibacterium sp. TEGAF015]|uniref:hypothetical protein n=1 Tax=Sediminibacterium sp. TEGAF015 TaxID=575378 RepID=UPI0021FFEB87|nr:hypothetical protein [Sediminibacterium sp. TEGAF015]BDQ12756.1 hypothetical protein TEGAF0_19730 [Sediminibacterium sp. TEGAF015]